MALKGYDPTNWSPGMAITANRMMNIEQALDGAVDAIISLETTTQGLRTDVDTKASSTALSDLSDIVSRKADNMTVTTLSGLIGDTLLTENTLESFISSKTITGQLTEAILAIHNIRSSSGNGDAAYSALTNIGAFGGNSLFDQIYEAVGYTGTGANRTLLYPRNGADDEGNSISFTIKQDLDNVRDKITNLNSIITAATTAEYNSLADRINAVATIALAARSDVAGATGDPNVSLPSKISSIDSNLLAINTQLTAAKASTAWGNKENLGTAKTFLDGTDTSGNPVYGIDARLEAMESYILDDSTGLESRIMNIFGNNINESNTVALAIAAINSKLGNGISSQNTVTSAIATALETAEAYANDEKVDKDDIVNDYNYVPSGDAAISTRLHKVLSASRGKDLNDRLTAKETEITNAHSSTIKGTNNTPRTFNSLDERFEDIETDVNTIANELSMYNQAGAISDANTRIDTIEKNVLEMGKEIGMISDLSTVQNLSDTVVRNDTDIDKLKALIAGARIQIGTDAQGNPTYQYADLDGRFDTIEDLLNNSTTGVAPRVTALEADMEAAEGKIEVLEGTTATGAVKYGDIINNIDTPNDASHANKVLDARQGATIKAIKTEVEGAHRTLASGVADTLDNRFDDIESRATTVENTVNNPTTGISMLNTRVGTLESSLSGYTGANAVSSKFSSVDTEIGTIKSTINMNEFGTTAGNTVADKLNTKVAKADVVNDLTTTIEGKVLDARQGKALNDAISTIDTAYKAADTALSGRITTALNEIDAAHRANVTNDTLDIRFDDIEGRATTLETKVTNIANELLMTNIADLVVDVNSRIDTIETNVVNIGKELGMLLDDAAIEDLSTAVSRNNTEIDNINATIGNDSTAGSVKGRITALETTVDTLTTGLSDRMTSAEGRLDALDASETGAIAGLDSRIDTINYTISHTATQEDNTTGLTQHISALETTVNDNTTGVAATATALGNLTDRVDTLATKDTIVVPYDGQHSNYTNDEPNSTAVPTPSTSPDYLIADDDGKYFYWRYFGAGENQGWQKISGAGGGGTGSSSGLFIASLSVFEGQDALVPDENIDYFVGNGTDGYTHYRYRSGNFVRILPNNLLINGGVDGNGGIYAYTVDNDSTNVFGSFNALKNVISLPGSTTGTTDLIFTDTTGNTTTINITGGGGGAAATSYPRLTNRTGTLSLLVPETELSAELTVLPTIYLDGQENPNYSDTPLIIYTQYRYNNISDWTNYKDEAVDPSQDYTVDVGSLLSVGQTMYVRLLLRVTLDNIAYERNISYTLNKVEMSIRANNFEQSVIRRNDFRFAYTLIGNNLTKVVHFEVDGTDAVEPFTTTSHNDYLTLLISINNLEDGMHSLRVYFTVNNKSSNILNYYFITSTDTTRLEPLVALAAEKETITYGDELKINYTVAAANNKTTTDTIRLTLYAIENGQQKQYGHLEKSNEENNIVDTWSISEYPLKGTAYVHIEASNVIDGVTYTSSKTITITINELQINYSDYGYQGEDALVYSYNAYGRTNNDMDKEEYTYIFTTLNSAGTHTDVEIPWKGRSINFNWSGNGYLRNENALTISGNAYHTVDVPIFLTTFNYNNDTYLIDSETRSSITKKGRTIEIEYEVEAAADLNATIMDFSERDVNDNITNTRLKVTPLYCYLLKANGEINIDESGFIINESDVAAAYLTPGVRTHLTFVIEEEATTLAFDKQYHQSVNIYVNGEFANACPYKKTEQLVDDFATSATLRIGNPNCVIKLYLIKMYNRALSHMDVLRNYKMAPPVTIDKLARYADNDILDGNYKVKYDKAIKKYNCLLLVGPEPIYGYTTKGEQIITNPTVSPYKGYPSPASRTDKKTGEVVGKTESGIILTKPAPSKTEGYVEEFHLTDTIPTDPNISVPSYIGQRGAYCSSNNVQGTSSLKYPVHNLKVYLAKWEKKYTRGEVVADPSQLPSGTKTETVTYKHVPHDNDDGYDLVEVTEGETVPDGMETEDITYVLNYTSGDIKKVKYCLKGKDAEGHDKGSTESTLCWKADYMSTDHANTYNANIADKLFPTTPLTGASWGSTHQNTVNGIRCLLFLQLGNSEPEFLGDGCLNNDKGNNKTFSLERSGDQDPEDGNDTASQKFEFTNNSDDLGYFKTDTLFKTIGETKYIVHTIKTAVEYASIPEGTEIEELEFGEVTPNGDKTVTEEVYNETATGERYIKESIKISEEDNLGNINLVDLVTYYLLNVTKETKTEGHYLAKDAFESTYPDLGDLEDNGHEPNYNHLQVLCTWLSKRANYWDETNSSRRAEKRAIFRNEFSKHINLGHALVYYIFCEYTAMADNRVKNMFFRTDNARQEEVYTTDNKLVFSGNGERGPGWDDYVNADGTTNDVIDWSRNTFCEWAPVLYDLDSCFGAENVGYLRIRYDAGWDYLWNTLPQFNGYESRLWLMFADVFDSEIRATAKTLYDRSDGLNYVNFYNSQIADNLSNISPALSNLDMLIKFDKPWSEGFINYALTEPKKETPEYKYLQRGSRAAQKTLFISLRSKLLSSKYGANEFLNDAIKFRTGRPVGASTEIIGYKTDETGAYIYDNNDLRIPIYADGDLSETEITVTANQTLYPGIGYGDNKAPTRYLLNGGRIAADTSCTIRATSAVQGNDGLFIYGASAITDIGDISRFCPYQLDLGAGTNLKRLIVGSHRPGFVNNGTNGFINLGSCVLLEEVNIENCIALSDLDLSSIPLIKTVYATGSTALTILFPDGGVLETVEYGASTTQINLRNLSRFTNFAYEGNDYAALTSILVENTPNVPVIDIINARLSNLTNGIRLIGLDIDIITGLTGEDYNAAVQKTTLFLNKISSTLAQGKKLLSTGAKSTNSAEYPDITGKIYIPRIRRSIYNKVTSIYPNLIIYSSFVNGEPHVNLEEEYTITYYNYDGVTEVYTDYRTAGEEFIDPVSDINTNTGRTYYLDVHEEATPIKPSDAQYDYRFGTYTNQGVYLRYSGWNYYNNASTGNPTTSSTVSGDTYFIAVYPTTIVKTYSINWYEEAGSNNPLNAEPVVVEYGTDGSSLTAPSVPLVKTSGQRYKVFNGWDRPIGKITENTNVYAKWLESTIDGNMINSNNFTMSNLNAADLYTLSVNSNKSILYSRLIDLDPIFINMGYDPEYTAGVNTNTIISNTYELDGSTSSAIIENTIKPLATNSDWTLALDYKLSKPGNNFLSKQEFVIVSCYLEIGNSKIGFKVVLERLTNTNVHLVKVKWGDLERVIDYVSYNSSSLSFTSSRNIIVLSHNSSDSNGRKLKISFMNPNSTNAADPMLNYGHIVTQIELTWLGVISSLAPLIIGSYYNDDMTRLIGSNDTDTSIPARAAIYWCKYWDKDLGGATCNRIASWVHERVPFYLTGYNGNDPDGITQLLYNNTNLSFIAAQGMGDRFFYATTTPTPDSDGLMGWHNSKTRQICNNLIYRGMPQAYQSVIRNALIASLAKPQTQENGSTIKYTNDYLFLPALREVLIMSGDSPHYIELMNNTSWEGPWKFMVTNNRKYIGYNEDNALQEMNLTNANIFKVRFLGKYINSNTRIFDFYSNRELPSQTDPTSVQLTLNGRSLTVLSGDIWMRPNNIDDNTLSGTTPYIFINSDEIDAGEYIDVASEGTRTETQKAGGWRKAKYWNLRSIKIENSLYVNEGAFMHVSSTGVVSDPSFRPNTYSSELRLICPEFTI